MIKVKICGITNSEDAYAASRAGADALGFIFSRKSPRYINDKAAKDIISGLDPFIVKVGVFVDEDKDRVLATARGCGLDCLQFHGKESPSYCKFFSKDFKVIKVLFPQDRPFKDKLDDYKVDAFLIDVKYEDKQKGEKKLSKTVMGEISRIIKDGHRVIISGGLNTKNVSSIKKLGPYGVDVASGVEEFVGKKDGGLVRLFIKTVKS